MHLQVVIFLGAVAQLMSQGETQANHHPYRPYPGPIYPPPPIYRPPPVYPPAPVYPPIAKPPTDDCDACEKADSGFDDQDFYINKLWGKLTSLIETFEGCDDGDGADLAVFPKRDNDPVLGLESTTPACPGETFVISCRCNHEDNDKCKGVKVSDDFKTCTVTPATSSDTVQAIALCAPNDGDEFSIEKNDGDTTSVTCDSPRKAIDCWKYDPEFPSVINYDDENCECGSGNCQLAVLCKTTVKET